MVTTFPLSLDRTSRFLATILDNIIYQHQSIRDTRSRTLDNYALRKFHLNAFMNMVKADWNAFRSAGVVSILDLGLVVDRAECQSDRRHERSGRTGTMSQPKKSPYRYCWSDHPLLFLSTMNCRLASFSPSNLLLLLTETSFFSVERMILLMHACCS